VNAQIEIESSTETVTFEIQERRWLDSPWHRTSAVMYDEESAYREWAFYQEHSARRGRMLRLAAVRRTTIVVNEVLES
jgi:hypothetical protein